MKLLDNVSAVAALAFVATGFFRLWKLGSADSDLSICILAFLAAITLSFGRYLFHLRGRIEALEKRLRGHEQ